MAGGIAVVAALLAAVAFRMFFSAQHAEKKATRQLETTYWINGVNERDRNNNPLKASHYFMHAAELTDDPASSDNARLAGTLLTEGVRLAAILEHQGSVWGAVFSADGRRILTWSADGTARLWDSDTGKPLAKPMRHQQAVNGALFSMDGRRILTWSLDGTARLWNLDVDYTWPKEYLVLQVEVFTGTRLNEEVGDLQALSAEEWQKKKDQYEKIKGQLAAK